MSYGLLSSRCNFNTAPCILCLSYFITSKEVESYRHSDKRKCFSLVVIAPVLGKISGPTLNEAEYDTKN